MCGIAGLWHRDGHPVDEIKLQAMIDSQGHRGRDDSGTWCNGDIGLAHRRLSILDLTSVGHQPMHADVHGLHLTFNGEIHNYLELRDELIAHGHAFRTQTDTEVVLFAYAQWGHACFERFNGMWALAIWDEPKQELILSRDRFGIKPLVVAVQGETVLFASEAKGLLAAAPDLNQPNWKQVYTYLRASVTDIGTDTFFRDIVSLTAGHTLRITRSRIETLRHWTFQPGREDPCPNAVETFRDLLTDSVKIRLRSDAPLGIWLSGGLDSSTIAGIASHFSDQPVHCFSMRYPDHPRFDESDYIKAVAAHFPSIDLHWVDPVPTGIIATIGDIVRHHDAPTVMRGRYACWTLAKETAKQVKVVLSGDGADELLGGYQTFAAPYALDRLIRSGPGLTRSPRAIRREYAELVKVAQPGLSEREVMLRALRCRLGHEAGAYPMICPDDFATKHGPSNPAHHYAAWASWCGHKPYRSLLNNALWREFLWRGLPEMMKGFDAVSMAHTLELRSPFLDHRVVEFCFSLPYYEKIRDGRTKRLLRDAFNEFLPAKVSQRRHKLGFPSPLHDWFADPKTFREAKEFLLDGEGVRAGLYEPRRLEAALTHLEHHEQIEGATRQGLLWSWVSMDWWLRHLKLVS